MTITGISKLESVMAKQNSLVCVGLDSDRDKLPRSVLSHTHPQFAFNKAIIDATHEYVCAYKPNIAFYEARGEEGIHELKMTMDYLRGNFPDIFTICDAKRADIGNTNKGYVEFVFDHLGFDAITLHPYLGREALLPFLNRKDKVSIILCKTSNPGSDEFQNMSLEGVPLYLHVAQQVATNWNTNGNCMLVVGATYPEELQKVRKLVGDMHLLVPGIGAQGGDLEKIMQVGHNSNNTGMVINSSREILFSSSGDDFAQAASHKAKQLHERINMFRT